MNEEAGSGLWSGGDDVADRGETPARSLSISVMALAVAATLSMLRPDEPTVIRPEYWGLVWVLALVPPFLLSYYRGWGGALAALAVGMVVLTGTEVVGRTVLNQGVQPQIYGFTTLALIVVSLGAGFTSEGLHRAGGDPAGAETRARRKQEIARAIERGELILHYQPIVELADGSVAGMEALVRWNHPELGLLSPGQFVNFAEGTELIVPLGEWVIDEACARHGLWRGRLAPGDEFFLSVNLSVQQCRDPSLPRQLERVLDRYDLSPDELQLEITETALLEARGRIEALRDLGVLLAIDDFGKGYSSLSYLHRIEVHALKIDAAFIEGLEAEDASAGTIVRSVIQLAESLGMKVTAEGIETERQHRELLELGCDYGQGYYLSRPLPLDEDLERLPIGP